MTCDSMVLRRKQYRNTKRKVLLLKAAWIAATTSITTASQEPQKRVSRTLDEASVLSTLYAATSGSSWTTSTNWLSGSICTWHGVGCTKDGTVERIELSGNNLRGSAPLAALLGMPHLKVLKLDGNTLLDYRQGAIRPNTTATATAEVTSNVQLLDLSHTTLGNLSGLFSAPPEDAPIRMNDLTDLYLTNTRLSAAFPTQVLDLMPNVERLVLDMNNLDGTLPVELGRLVQLRYLSLRDNQFTGNLPARFEQLRKLRYFVVRGNRLGGSIPSSLYEDLPLLEHLDLSRQKDVGYKVQFNGRNASTAAGLTGRLPAFANSPDLRQLDLSFNSLSGPIPDDFLSNVNLRTFDYAFLGDNELSGVVPSSALIRLPVDSVFLHDNQITGLEPALCDISRGGAIATFKNCSAILCPPGTYGQSNGRQEDIKFPCEACPLNDKYWGASYCHSTNEGGGGGGAPTKAPTMGPTTRVVLTELEILTKLYAATGGPNWEKSFGWENVGNDDDVVAESVAASFCRWYGVLCAYSSELGTNSVKSLLLGSNNLVGDLPTEVFQLKNLQTLDLHQNSLAIDLKGIGETRSLSTLDLSSTMLYNVSGIKAVADTLKELHLESNNFPNNSQIPTELFLLTNLQTLSLDNNQFIGTIPQDIGNLTGLVLFTASNNLLTGELPGSFSKLSSLTTFQVGSNKLYGNLSLAVSRMSLMLTDLDLSTQRGGGGQTGFSGTLPDFARFRSLQRLNLQWNDLTGDVPTSFLKTVDPKGFQYADLSHNFLKGAMPASLASIPNVYLKENRISSIDPAVCGSLQNTPYESFGCDAIMCKPGTYNSLGRHISYDTPCEKCKLLGGAKYYGSTTCSNNYNQTNSIPTQSSGSQLLTADRDILVLFYTDCGGPQWTDSSNWIQETTSVCTWKGIDCNENQKVTGVTLPSNNIVGTLPRDMFNIAALNKLALDGNKVKVSFDGIESAKSLEHLDLSQISLASVEGISAAKNLTELYLTSNSLIGTFPEELLQLTGLKSLSLAFNSLTGEFPSAVSSLSNLEFLSVESNKFSGTIPDSFGTFEHLQFLLLQSNNFTGSVPQSIDTIQSVWFVDLSEQKGLGGRGLAGQLPAFSSLTSLQRLDLSDNSFNGSIPDNFLAGANGTDLDYVDLSKNSLSGTAPALLAKIPVRNYNLADNKITGIDPALCNPNLGGIVKSYLCDAVLCPPGSYNKEGRQLWSGETCKPCSALPSDIYGFTTCPLNANSPTKAPTISEERPTPSLSDREILSAFYTACGGPGWERHDKWLTNASICEWFGVGCVNADLETVRYLALSTNNLVGSVPGEVFDMPQLETLVLDSNKILLNFSNIGSAKSLLTLDLSATELFSVQGLERAINLKELQVSSNAFDGTFPSEFWALTNLEQLFADYNSIKGPLPSEIGLLSNLHLLSFASNLLSGTLPESIGNLTSLLTWRFQGNMLRSTIPSALEKMSSLVYVDLSDQRGDKGTGFSGSLFPFKSQKDLRRLVLSKNSLNGTIPQDFLLSVNSDNFEFVDLSKNQLSGSVPSSLGRLGSLSLQDNDILNTSAYCDSWVNMGETQFGCDAFLCPPKTFNSIGKRDDGMACTPCSSAQYYGTTTCQSDGDIAANSTERDILVRLYNSCGGYYWRDDTNWLSNNTNICKWAGIVCTAKDNQSVTNINLGANNLKGVPPKELFYLPNLQTLSLYSNPLGGFDFSTIGRATNLMELQLDSTNITSLAGVAQSKSLQTLNARFNPLEDVFPADLLGMTNLKSVLLSNTGLTGPLPSGLAGMLNLENLLLSFNELKGNLFDVKFPQSLKILDLSNNLLQGSIPSTFLEGIPSSFNIDIDLSNNELTGTVPPELSRFDQLDLLLKNNHISGIAPEICQKSAWNDGNVGTYGCDGLLCSAGFYAPTGRSVTDDSKCTSCEGTEFYGSTACNETSGNSRSYRRIVWLSASFISAIVVFWISWSHCSRKRTVSPPVTRQTNLSIASTEWNSISCDKLT